MLSLNNKTNIVKQECLRVTRNCQEKVGEDTLKEYHIICQGCKQWNAAKDSSAGIRICVIHKQVWGMVDFHIFYPISS